MPDDVNNTNDLFEELKEVRRRGLGKLEATSGRKRVATTKLEHACESVPGYIASVPRSTRIENLLRYEIERLSAKSHREQLVILFGLKDGLDSYEPGELSKKAANTAGETNHNNYSRTGGARDDAIRALAAQIAAECFDRKQSLPDEPQLPEPSKKEYPKKLLTKTDLNKLRSLSGQLTAELDVASSLQSDGLDGLFIAANYIRDIDFSAIKSRCVLDIKVFEAVSDLSSLRLKLLLLIKNGAKSEHYGRVAGAAREGVGHSAFPSVLVRIVARLTRSIGALRPLARIKGTVAQAEDP